MKHRKNQQRQVSLRVKIFSALCIVSLLYGTVAMALPGTEQQKESGSFHSDSVPKEYFYDANGNHVKTISPKGEENKTYDVLGRIIRYEGPDGVEEYTYIGTGAKRHSVKRTPAGSTTTKISHFLYDDENAVIDYYGVSFEPSKQYVTFGLDQYLSVSDLIDLKTKSYYYSQDGLNSVRTLTDPFGALHSQQDYKAFGDPFNAAVASLQSYGYTGREQSSIHGDMYYRYRNFSPRDGRFDSRDPLGYLDNSMGLIYGYVEANPVNYNDPYGLVTLKELCSHTLRNSIHMDGWRFNNLLNSYLSGGYKNDPEMMAVINQIRDLRHTGDPNWKQKGYQLMADLQSRLCPDKTVDLPHQFRNAYQSCPEREPCSTATNWESEGGNSANPFHSGRSCYRGKGRFEGSQCCYRPDGSLDDSSFWMGTYDYTTPGDDTVGHFWNDVFPHFNVKRKYAKGLSQTYKSK